MTGNNTLFVVYYTGNHTGKHYENDLIGIAKSEDEAKELMLEIIKEDLETYDELFNGKDCKVEYSDKNERIEQTVVAKGNNILPVYPVNEYKIEFLYETPVSEYISYKIKKQSFKTLDEYKFKSIC